MAEDKFDIQIVGNEATWHMRLEGNIEGTYTGTFKFRCYLTPSQKIAANREMRQMLGEQMALASQHEANLAFALTQLKYRVISSPPFWNTGNLSGDIPDTNVIMAVLDAAVAAELQYLDQIKERKLDAIARAKAAAEHMLSNRDEEDFDEGETEESPD